jgi:hypothetical protein
MAKAEYIYHLLSLIIITMKNERFTTLALQMETHEAKLGHPMVATEIKKVVDKAKTEQSSKTNIFSP